MLIVNADDWGRGRRDTDAALTCFEEGRLTSVSAMVFMADSERAAELARAHDIDVGLHVNFTQEFSAGERAGVLNESHRRVRRFLNVNKYAQLLYHPGLRQAFRDLYEGQAEEFLRLYGREPSHVDGHQHMHLCANMLMGRPISRGQVVRRNFSFEPGQKGPVNRAYRHLVDKWLLRRYRSTDRFYGLSRNIGSESLRRIAGIAQGAEVELMSHPALADEYECLMSAEYREILGPVLLSARPGIPVQATART